VRDAEGTVLRWIGTCTDIDRIVRAEEALRELNETLEVRVAERSAEVEALARALTLAEQEERGRLAEVLHDDLQQLLVGAKMRLGVSATDAAHGAEVGAILDESIRVTRLLSTELAPSLLQGEGLREALEWLASRSRGLHHLDVTVAAEDGCLIADSGRRILLYQVVRELLFNVSKHAGTDRATVRAWQEGGEVRIAVEDEGTGFDPALLGKAGGFGLTHVQERLRMLGGTVRVESTPGEGTRVELAVPAPAADPLVKRRGKR